MKSKSILLIGAASVAMGFMAPAAFAGDMATKPAGTTAAPAATNTAPPGPMEQGAAQAGTNVQKAAGVKDSFTAEEAATVVLGAVESPPQTGDFSFSIERH